jgi:hypothetical protein
MEGVLFIPLNRPHRPPELVCATAANFSVHAELVMAPKSCATAATRHGSNPCTNGAPHHPTTLPW